MRQLLIHFRAFAARLSAHCVKVLTVLSVAALAGCSVLKPYQQPVCKSRAWVQSPVQDFISSRFPLHAPVRMAVVPFSVPVNVSEKSDQQPGLGNKLAWHTQAELMRWGVIPIVEILPREDWPGKQEEIFTGNFGALERAHAADYDLLLVGRLLPSQSLSEVNAVGKVIAVEDGITLWYGEVSAYTFQGEADKWKAAIGLEKYNPSKIYSNPLSEKLAYCIAKQVMSEEVTPS